MTSSFVVSLDSVFMATRYAMVGVPSSHSNLCGATIDA